MRLCAAVLAAALLLSLSACVQPPRERTPGTTFSPPQTELNRR